MEKLSKGHLFRVEMVVALPCEATAEQAEEWLIYEASQSGGISCENPLSNHSIDLWRNDIDVRNLRRVGTATEYDHEETENGGRRWKVCYKETPA